ncbi:MAG: ArsA family ATPase [Calditrichaeota bacterium]|nr:ArsA family ATPase [Calditrichota bacterium]
MTSVVDILQNKSVIFFAGKGGVGKTTCAAAYALLCAEKGDNTLLVSTDPAHSLSDIFAQKIGDKIRNILPQFQALEINPVKEAKKYIRKVQSDLGNVISPVLIEEIKRQIEAAYLSPGAEEAAIFDKFIELIEDEDSQYKKLIFDTAPTGHTLRLFSLPEILGAWIDRLIQRRKKTLHVQDMFAAINGNKHLKQNDSLLSLLQKRKKKFEYAREILTDSNKTGFVFVLNPERLPLLETKMSIKLLKKHGIGVSGAIVNRITPHSEHEFLRQRREVEEKYLIKIHQLFGKKILAEIPLIERDICGIDELRMLQAYFEIGEKEK